MAELRFAQGTLNEAQFERAAAVFARMDAKNIAVARAFLVSPGKHQVIIAQEHKMNRQLVHKHCKRVHDAYLKLADREKTTGAVRGAPTAQDEKGRRALIVETDRDHGNDR